MASNRDERLQSIIGFLRGQTVPVTVADLAQRLRVSERTVFRDLTTLRDRGVSILGLRSHGGGVRLASGDQGIPTGSSATAFERLPGPRTHRPSSQANLHAPPFVGRDTEFTQLRASLQRAGSGAGQIVLLTGEPGIGKSRIAQETAAEAAAQGMLAVTGRCLEDEGAPAYWPWIQVLRHIAAAMDFPEPGTVNEHLARIAVAIPELAQLAPGSSPPVGEDPEQAEFRLLNAMTVILTEVANRQPLMIVLEDLHWADRSSLKLVEFIAPEMGSSAMLITATARNIDSGDHPGISTTLAALARHDNFLGLRLLPMDIEESTRLLESVAGSDAPGPLAESVYALTEGNPFFTVEVARLLAQQGDLSDAQDIEVPDAARAVITGRLDRLSTRCTHVLTIAAILGSEFGFDELQYAVGDVSDRELLAIIDESLQTHVIVESPQALERYRFAHALIRRVLSDGVSSSQRARYHAQAAAALERLYEAEVDDYSTRLARHFILAGSVGDRPKLAHYSLKAGERALASYALEEALGHFEDALAASQPESSGRPLAEIYFNKGRVEAWLGDGRRAVASLNRAFDIFVEIGDTDAAVDAVSIGIVTGEVGKLPELVNFHSRGLELAPPGSVSYARLLVEHGHALTSDGMDYEGAVQAFVQAITIADREGDDRLLAHALLNLSMAQGIHASSIELAESTLQRARRLFQGFDDPQKAFTADAMSMIYLFDLGRLQEIRPYLERLELNIAESRWVGFGPKLQFARTSATLALFEGRWDDARRFSGEFSELVSNPVITGYLALVDLLTDAPSAVVDDCLAAITGGDFRSADELDVGLTLALAESGRLTGDSRAFEAIEGWAMVVMSNPHTFRGARIVDGMLGLVAVARGDVAGAEELYQSLEGQKGEMQLNLGPGGPDRILGLLAGTIGGLDDSAKHFEDALEICRRSAATPWLALAIHDYVGMLVQWARPTERNRRATLLSEGLAICREYGMAHIEERLVALQEEAATADAGNPSGLTDREIEVFGLVAAGLTNKQIADELIVTINTVQSHVSSILSKTGSANRVEATRWAGLAGLLNEGDSTD